MATIVSSVGLKGMEGYLVQVGVQLLPRIAAICSRVEQARSLQYKRYGQDISNPTVSNEKLLDSSSLTAEHGRMIQKWSSKYHWSTRTQMKIRRLARTISDLQGEAAITNEAIWEAVTIRRTQDTMSRKGMVK